MVIAIGASAVLGLSFYLRRQTKRLQTENHTQFHTQFKEQPVYRPLFAPTDEEILVLEREEESRKNAKIEEEIRQAKAQKVEEVGKFQAIWLDQPNTGNTIEFLRLAAASETSEAFSDAARHVLNFWNDKKIDNLSAKNLADLLDSHFRTLPQQERASGVSFWLKQEILSLRRQPEESS